MSASEFADGHGPASGQLFHVVVRSEGFVRFPLILEGREQRVLHKLRRSSEAI